MNSNYDISEAAPFSYAEYRKILQSLSEQFDIIDYGDIDEKTESFCVIRHDIELITIYGRLTNVLVVKGAQVVQGQKIGDVIEETDTDNGLMHFEVRKGMQSIDPETMIR